MRTSFLDLRLCICVPPPLPLPLPLPRSACMCVSVKLGANLECTEVLGCNAESAVVECLFDAGHECNYDYMDG
jgi:hypothetical protein